MAERQESDALHRNQISERVAIRCPRANVPNVRPAGRPISPGYTRGMKTAVSVPDDVFEKAERLARSAGRSRSEVYSAALREYVARHAPNEVTEQLDRVVLDIGEPADSDSVMRAAARKTIESSDW